MPKRVVSGADERLVTLRGEFPSEERRPNILFKVAEYGLAVILLIALSEVAWHVAFG